MGRPAKHANPRQSTMNAGVQLDIWPGITRGFDSRCSCTWAHEQDVYQVKVRDRTCRNHGGDLEAALVRMARWR